jgi:hypothetical protein
MDSKKIDKIRQQNSEYLKKADLVLKEHFENAANSDEDEPNYKIVALREKDRLNSKHVKKKEI